MVSVAEERQHFEGQRLYYLRFKDDVSPERALLNRPALNFIDLITSEHFPKILLIVIAPGYCLQIF